MKKFTFLVALIMIIASMYSSLKAQWNISGSDIYNSNAGNVGVGTAGATNASSLLEVRSTTKGVLIPRMTKAQRDAIVSPATGLLIYQTNNSPAFYFFDGSAWTKIATGSGGANKNLSNLTAATAVNIDLLPGTAGTLDLGSSANRWKDIYLNGTVYMGGSPVIRTTVPASVIAFGFEAGLNNTTGGSNSAFGYRALKRKQFRQL
jgi:hypothetical protein